MLKERIEEFSGYAFNSLLCNLYRNEKDSVDWHSDDEPSLGKNPIIASLSFGATRTFEMRKKPSPVSVLIAVKESKPICLFFSLYLENLITTNSYVSN